jgi:hypothetical protein
VPVLCPNASSAPWTRTFGTRQCSHFLNPLVSNVNVPAIEVEAPLPSHLSLSALSRFLAPLFVFSPPCFSIAYNVGMAVTEMDGICVCGRVEVCEDTGV